MDGAWGTPELSPQVPLSYLPILPGHSSSNLMLLNTIYMLMTHTLVSSARTSSLNSRPVTSPLEIGILTSPIQKLHPPYPPPNSLLKLVLPTIFLIWLMVTILPLLKPKSCSHLKYLDTYIPSFHTPYPIYQEILLEPHAKYIQNLTISHCPHCHYSCPRSSAMIISLLDNGIGILAGLSASASCTQSIHQSSQSSQIRSQIMSFLFSKPISLRGKATLSGQDTTPALSGSYQKLTLFPPALSQSSPCPPLKTPCPPSKCQHILTSGPLHLLLFLNVVSAWFSPSLPLDLYLKVTFSSMSLSLATLINISTSFPSQILLTTLPCFIFFFLCTYYKHIMFYLSSLSSASPLECKLHEGRNIHPFFFQCCISNA